MEAKLAPSSPRRALPSVRPELYGRRARARACVRLEGRQPLALRGYTPPALPSRTETGNERTHVDTESQGSPHGPPREILRFCSALPQHSAPLGRRARRCDFRSRTSVSARSCPAGGCVGRLFASLPIRPKLCLLLSRATFPLQRSLRPALPASPTARSQVGRAGRSKRVPPEGPWRSRRGRRPQREVTWKGLSRNALGRAVGSGESGFAGRAPQWPRVWRWPQRCRQLARKASLLSAFLRTYGNFSDKSLASLRSVSNPIFMFATGTNRPFWRNNA